MFQTATQPVGMSTPPRPKWQLAGRSVSQAMFYDAQQAKRDGRRVLFTTADGGTHADDCPNCLGFGQLCLEVIMCGPFREMPAGTADDVAVALRPACHNNAWWQVTRTLYPCPVCQKEVIL